MTQKRAVTLIEVVVVVAIILIVAAIAMVVMLNSKHAAKRITCVGNLSQMGKALALYAADHDNRYPPYNTWDSDAMPSVPSDPVAKRGLPALYFKRALMAYGMTDAQFYCPEDPQAHKDIIDPPEYIFRSEMTYEHVFDLIWFQSI